MQNSGGCLTVIRVFYLFLQFTFGQQLTFRQTRWVKTALQNVSFHGYKARYEQVSILRCAVECLHNSPCLSLSFHVLHRRCLIFSSRVSFGIDMQLEEGYNHYWRLEDHCPDGYTYNSEVHVCYKPSARTAKLSWMDAFYNCSNENAHLFISNTLAKRDILAAYIRNNNFTYIQFKLGGNDLFQEGWWAWLDGSPVITWYSTQPDNGNADKNQHCMENTREHPDYNSDGICNSTERYICQIPLQ